LRNFETFDEAESEANDIYDTLEKSIAKYINEIMDEVPLTNEDILSDIETPEFMGIDVESLASFWDAVQECNGAKVGVSTGIEGSETYQFSYWITHMDAKDNYADLRAIESLIEESDDPTSFDGMWTSKGPLSVQIDEDGNVTTNISELLSTAEENEEVVTTVPEGFIVPDRSTDSYGKQVPSLYAAMVSKRSNGAEKFNLKAMKQGLDSLDSITKMRDKYLQKEYSDGYKANTLFFEVGQELESIALNQGINEARMELARRMKAQDNEMGYNDLTLANYMCIAEMMLIEREDGIALRSIEQLATATRGRIGAKVDGMTDTEVFEEVQKIISDTSDQGVGRSMVWDPRELLVNMKPNSSAGNASASIRVNSSVFQRNYDLLQEISSKTKVRPMTAAERTDAHRRIIGDNTDRNPGVNGVADVWKRSNIVRNYQVIGYAGAIVR
jgi:hypothetical protein